MSDHLCIICASCVRSCVRLRGRTLADNQCRMLPLRAELAWGGWGAGGQCLTYAVSSLKVSKVNLIAKRISSQELCIGAWIGSPSGVWVAPRVQGVKPSQRLPHRPPPTVNHGFINHSDVYAAVAHFCIWAVVSANQNFNLFPPSWLANRLKLSRQDPLRSKGSHLRYKKKGFL